MADIGDMGEHIFSYWCAEADIVCNGSKIDKTGWDFFIEFNNPLDESIPLDMHPPRIEAKIQVKSTQSKNSSVQVSLSNLQRLATAIQPAFFVFIEFDKNNKFLKAYLKHFDGELISKILYRLRKESAANNIEKINKKEMVIKYSLESDFEIINGKDLESAILACIPRGLTEYQKSKKEILSKVGFENGYGHINFTLNKEDIETFVDMSLGLDRTVTLKNAKFFNSRFGIEILDKRFPTDTTLPITLQIPDVKPSSTGKIRFIAKNSNSPSIDFFCELYTPIIHTKHLVDHKFRIRSEVFELLLFKDKLNFEFHIQDKKLDFKIIYKTIKLLYWIGDCNYEIGAEIELNDYSPIRLNSLGTVGTPNSYAELWDIVEGAKYLIDIFDILDVSVSLNDLTKYGYSILGLKNSLNLHPSQWKIHFNVNDTNLPEIENIACVCSFYAKLGEITFCLFLGIEGKAILVSDSKYTLQANSINLHKKLLFTEDACPDLERLEENFKSIEEYYINIGWLVFRIPDFQIFIPSTP